MAPLDLIAQVKQRIAHLTSPELAQSDLSLTNCDREPIHIPSAIQSHGVLLTFSAADLIILQISTNSAELLGQPPEAFLGQPLAMLMLPSDIEAVQSCLQAEFDNVNPLRLLLSVDGQPQPFEGIVHRSDGVVLLELEPAIDQAAVSFFDFYKSVKLPINHLQGTQNLAELARQAVTVIRNITGFDRVMLYRFHPDAAGHVIAENKHEDAESFLGLHYPATDIPQQAKELYRLNLLRIIPDALSDRVALQPELNPVTSQPLDLSLSVLRSVSPVHTEYLANMGVQASMSISLLRDRQLWGLLACHHPTPRRLSYETRTICEFLGQVISFEVGAKADAEDLEYRMQLQTVHSRFVNTIANCQTLTDALNQNSPDLMELAGATGVVFCENSKIIAFGQTPPEETIGDLITWIDQQIGEDAVYSTNTLVANYPLFQPHKDFASGLLALQISRIQQSYLLWFRPEVIQTIDWGGDPRKSSGEDTHDRRITPRKSFALWKETVQLTSLPWKTYEIDAALELRSRIIGIVLQKADELALLNAELERSNIELDSFAYVASHDLKEPLRGIHNYSTFLIEDYADKLGEEGTKKLTTLMRLTRRMEDLINSLLHYSQFGRAELQFQPVNLGEMVEAVLDVIKISQPSPTEFQILRPLPVVQTDQTNATERFSIRIPRPLPIVECDRTQVNELFTNLISNAIKYNNQAEKWVEIGYILPEEFTPNLPESLNLNPPQTVFFIKDNGIGIRSHHLETIFKIFKRLHAPGAYGDGTGAGLTIAKKVVERHSGSIAVESTYGEGSTFYFTLGERP
jgi:two-component system, chemotaxis family, sensor kinase Cph1